MTNLEQPARDLPDGTSTLVYRVNNDSKGGAEGPGYTDSDPPCEASDCVHMLGEEERKRHEEDENDKEAD